MKKSWNILADHCIDFVFRVFYTECTKYLPIFSLEAGLSLKNWTYVLTYEIHIYGEKILNKVTDKFMKNDTA